MGGFPLTLLRVATYNIRKCVGLDWRRRPDRVMRVLSELKADVVALQEADRRFGGRPSTLPLAALPGLTGLRVVPPAPGSASAGHHGNAILVREGIEVRQVRRLEIPSFEPRGGLMVELGIGTTVLRVVGVHLGLRRRDRMRQASALVDSLRHAAEEVPTLLMGDLNEWSPRNGAIAALERLFEPSRPVGSFHSTVPVAALDRIMLGPGLRFGHVSVHRTPSARRASDHLPVCADIVLPEPPARETVEAARAPLPEERGP